ncbi:hypothetical protein [Leucobacter sp. USHLN153]|uniref:hypothetical protein n=1 Tax=Leucobacter sp. USHLN153 TaxID=3081268 RepID=UPI00301ACCE3
MSTEPVVAGGRRKGLTGVAVIAILCLLAAGLAIANLVAPPRLQSIDVNPELLISRASQRAQLHLSQPVAEVAAGAVRVTPETPIDVTSEAGTLTVRFLDALRTDTQYRVTARVTGAATGSTGAVTATFRTPDPWTHTLARGDAGDRVLAHRLGDPSSTRTVFEAPRIQEYAEASTGLTVITRGDDGAAELTVHDGDAPPFRIMGAPELGQLRSEALGGVLGVVASGRGDDGTQYDRTLLIIDPRTRIVETVSDSSGAALPVRDWRFVPGTTSVVFQTPDGKLHGWEAAPTPRSFELGVSGDLLGFAPGSTGLAVAAGTQSAIIDLSGMATGALGSGDGELPASTPLPVAAASGSDPDPRSVLALSETSVLWRSGASVGPVGSQGASRDGGDARSAGSALGDGSRSRGSALLVKDSSGAREVFRPAADGTAIGRVCLSPNGEFAAVETISSEGQPDDVPVAPGSSHTTTRYVRIADGATMRSAVGGLSDWCR